MDDDLATDEDHDQDHDHDDDQDGDASIPDGVLSPREEHRRAVVLTVLVELGTALLVLGPTVVTALHDGEPAGWAVGVGGLGTLLLAIWPLHAADVFGPAVVVGGRPAHLLTGRTFSGWRSVDLWELSTVRLRYNLGHAPTPAAEVMLTDTSGARLGVSGDDPPPLAAIREALHHSAGRSVRVSPKAAVWLGLEPDAYPTCGERRYVLPLLGLWALVLLGYGVLLGALSAASAG